MLWPCRPHNGTILLPCLGHIRAMFWLFLQYPCFYMPICLAKFSLKSNMIRERKLLMWNNWDHIRAIYGSSHSHVLAIDTIYLLLEVWKCSNIHSIVLQGPQKITLQYQIFSTIFGPCFGHIMAIFWLFLQYLYFQMPEMAKNFTEESCIAYRGRFFNVELLWPYWGHVWEILGHVLDISVIFLLVGIWNG